MSFNTVHALQRWQPICARVRTTKMRHAVGVVCFCACIRVSAPFSTLPALAPSPEGAPFPPAPPDGAPPPSPPPHVLNNCTRDFCAAGTCTDEWSVGAIRCTDSVDLSLGCVSLSIPLKVRAPAPKCVLWLTTLRARARVLWLTPIPDARRSSLTGRV